MKLKAPRIYLPQLLVFIFAGEICDNYIFGVFSEVSKNSTFQEFGFYLFFLILQIVFSPIQSGFSDFYCRKKSLVVSLSFSALSLIPAFLYFEHLAPIFLLCLMPIFKGILGNNLPLAWAGIADTQETNVRFSFALSTSAIALGYLALIVLSSMFNYKKLSIFIFCMFLLLIYASAAKFVDIRDKRVKTGGNEHASLLQDIKLIFNIFFKSVRFQKGLLTFMFWEISFYSAHMLDIDFKIRAFKGLTLAMILGYLLGVGILSQLSKKKDEEMIKIGYVISIISFVPIFVLAPFVVDIKRVIIPCYFLYALGAAFLVPSLFSILSKEREPREQGKIYGLMDSADTTAFLVSTIVAMMYNWAHLNKVFLVAISFLILVLSWWPYAGFKKAASTL